MAFRTIARMRQAARIPLTTSRNIWFKLPTDVNKPGHRLSLVFPGNKSAEVEIVKAFTPFTNSAALLVDAQTGHSMGLPNRFILKLADRRVYNKWSFEREENHQSNISKYGASFELRLDDDDDMLSWMDSSGVWELINSSYLSPRDFLGTTKINMLTMASHPSLNHIDGLLLEYISGRSMARIRPGITITFEEAEIISQRVLELGRRLRRYGVCHSDVHVGNITLREKDNSPVLIDGDCASFDVADLPLHERWNDQNVRADFHGDIRCLLRNGAYYKGPDDEVVYPTTITAGGVWHRFRTPLSMRCKFDMLKSVVTKG
ncbi:hypothetical protein C0995_014269 [Termitomyces sp. Mi166|nr:hypothetical protein C0995_014269 [Termitomyces sp. Mi166\